VILGTVVNVYKIFKAKNSEKGAFSKQTNSEKGAFSKQTNSAKTSVFTT